MHVSTLARIPLDTERGGQWAYTPSAGTRVVPLGQILVRTASVRRSLRVSKPKLDVPESRCFFINAPHTPQPSHSRLGEAGSRKQRGGEEATSTFASNSSCSSLRRTGVGKECLLLPPLEGSGQVQIEGREAPEGSGQLPTEEERGLLLPHLEAPRPSGELPGQPGESTRPHPVGQAIACMTLAHLVSCAMGMHSTSRPGKTERRLTFWLHIHVCLVAATTIGDAAISE